MCFYPFYTMPLPYADRWEGAPHATSIHPSLPSQERSYKAAEDIGQQTVSHYPWYLYNTHLN